MTPVSQTLSRPRPATRLAALLACGWLGLAPSTASAAPGTRIEVAQAGADIVTTRAVRLRFEATNETSQVLEGARMVAYVPVKETVTQQLLMVESSHPAELIGDELGNQALAIEIPRVAPRGIAVVIITAVVGLRASPAGADPGTGLDNLRAAPFIEADDAEIRQLAASLTRKSARQTALAVHRWIVSNVEYSGYRGKAGGARFALDRKKGDCTEMAYLFVALARAAGLRARFLAGWITESSGLLMPQTFHNWAEFHDGTTWQLVDPQKRVFAEAPERYLATRIAGAAMHDEMAGVHRFRSKTPGLTVRTVGVR